MQNNMTVHTINHVKNLKRIKIPRNIIKGWISKSSYYETNLLQRFKRKEMIEHEWQARVNTELLRDF